MYKGMKFGLVGIKRENDSIFFFVVLFVWVFLFFLVWVPIFKVEIN